MASAPLIIESFGKDLLISENESSIYQNEQKNCIFTNKIEMAMEHGILKLVTSNLLHLIYFLTLILSTQ